MFTFDSNISKCINIKVKQICIKQLGAFLQNEIQHNLYEGPGKSSATNALPAKITS